MTAGDRSHRLAGPTALELPSKLVSTCHFKDANSPLQPEDTGESSSVTGVEWSTANSHLPLSLQRSVLFSEDRLIVDP